jgi:hypothetical protein
MNCWKPDAVSIDDGMVLDPQLASKKFFQSDVKIMQKPGIVDDPGPVDISEANFKL